MIESYTHAGLTIEIHLDKLPIDCPLEYLENDAQFITFDRYSNLSDYHSYNSPKDIIFPDDGTEFSLYKYEHSSIAYSVSNSHYPFNCSWDSGRVGSIWVSNNIEDQESYVINLCNDVTAWCNGEVYVYLIKDNDDEVLASCGGFLGTLDHCKFEAEAEAVSCAERITKHNQERLKIEIKNHIPFERRTHVART